MRAFLSVLTLAGVAVVAGLMGYNAGLTSAAASSGASVVLIGGGPGFGTLFFLFLLGFLLLGFAGRRRHWAMGHHGHGPWGWRAWGGQGGPAGQGGPGTPSGGSGHAAFGPASFGPMGNPDDPRFQWISAMHRRMHEAEAAQGGTTTNHSASGQPGSPA